jgi:chemotaxis protein methyltransferase CheR
MALPLNEPDDLEREQREQRELLALEIDLLLTGIAEHYGYDFRNYARASLTRRVRKALQGEGLKSVSSLQNKLLHDEDAAMRFVASMSVHTTAMFRDPEVYRLLREQVIPMLRTYPFVRIWHAGCSSGEEVYSLAILLEEEGLYNRCRIYATDMSDLILDRARKGVFPLRDMREHTRAYHSAGGNHDFSAYYVTDQQSAVFTKSLSRHIVFSQHNLVCDSAFNEFQLIMCRNVLLYFDQTLRERSYQLFGASLSTFGWLVLGKQESLRFSGHAPQYRELRDAARVYRKL